MIWVDTKYANLLSSKLERYKVKSHNPFLANFRCPLCGDSSKNKNKARGYFYTSKHGLVMKCHNCGVTIGFSKLIQKLDTTLYQQYSLEKFGNKKIKNTFDFEPKFQTKSIVQLPDFIKCLNELKMIYGNDHPAVEYCINRKIPEEKFQYVYYIENVSRVTEVVEQYKDRIITNEQRIVLPFFNRERKPIGFTMRAMDNNKLRYMTIRLDDNEPMLFGHERVNFNRPVICVEGPIDSLFLSNAVAVSGSDMKKATRILPEDTTYVFDNQPRNKVLCKLMESVIKDGKKVCIWSNTIIGKDINDMAKIGYSVEKIIYSRSYTGLSAENAFREWRRC
tara:strand:- start:2409 stop:3413 length:1005 start_codon:yes stop_codon:yes gene_type:complete